MSYIRSRADLVSLVTTNLPSGTGNITAANHRAVENSLARSLLALGDAEAIVTSMSLTTPPASPSDRDAYVVGASATGDWAGQDDDIAIYDANGSPAGWFFITPADGQAVWNLADDKQYRWDAGASPAAWTAQSGGGSSLTKATAANIRAGAADVYIDPAGIESAAELVTLTDAATIAVDWSTFLTAQVTLGGNRTLGDPTNGEPGTWRTIVVKQDATGSRTLTFGDASPTGYRFAGGTAPTLTTTASAADVLSILCVSASEFYVFSALDLS